MPQALQIDVVSRPVERVKADAIVVAYGLPLRRDQLPIFASLRSDATRILVKQAGALTWLDGNGTAASRVLLACLGGAEERRPSFGWGGSVGDTEVRALILAQSRALGAAVETACHEQGVRRIAVGALPPSVDIASFVDGLITRAHCNREFRPAEPGSSVIRVTLCVAAEDRAQIRGQVQRAVDVAESVNLARTLTDLPANVGTPREIVRRIRALAEEVGLHVRALGPAQIRKRGMGLLEAVMQGAPQPGALVSLEHRPPGYRALDTLVLIGKGVVHDTGGYNLKRANLEAFTNDKAGGAAVIGAMRALALRQTPLHVVGIVPLVENLVGATAFKPGDVLRAMNGTTVFVDSTDAEGRLILADCLHWAAQWEPSMVVDLATLTGESFTALGVAFASLFANDDRPRQLVQEAGQRSGDLVWPMPIHELHAAELPHHLAELRNGAPAGGGASVAAAFLRRFVRYPWVHVDMAGLASSQYDGELLGAGSTGFGTRLLFETAELASR